MGQTGVAAYVVEVAGESRSFASLRMTRLMGMGEAIFLRIMVIYSPHCGYFASDQLSAERAVHSSEFAVCSGNWRSRASWGGIEIALFS
jgi:hypothetical protein